MLSCEGFVPWTAFTTQFTRELQSRLFDWIEETTPVQHWKEVNGISHTNLVYENCVAAA